MASVYTSIRDALATVLNTAYPDIPIYFEEINQINGNEPEEPEKYFFIDIENTGTKTEGQYRAEKGFRIDIAHFDPAAGNDRYNLAAEELDNLFRPVFRFGDRAITIHEANSLIVDKVLHYLFSMKFIHTAKMPEPVEEIMGELETELIID